MKTEKNILIAFLLNIGFSIFEIIGGIFTNSISIISDAIHDFGDAISIGISLFLEKKSKKHPDHNYTYGYARYSLLGALITSTILIIGSTLVIASSLNRFINPEEINYNGMIILSLIGVIINFLAAYFTREGDSLNQKSVNLHMLEDVLNWVIVLIGSILMKFTDISFIDPLMSLGVAIFILINAVLNVQKVFTLFLEKTPSNINISEITHHLKNISSIKGVHHIHLWSIDGTNNYATLHVVSDNPKPSELKKHIREELKEFNINHVTIEIESSKEHCDAEHCEVKTEITHHHHH